MAAAAALARTGWRVTVLEQAAVSWEAGAGLLVTPNGERALAALGGADAALAAGHRVRVAGIRDAQDRIVADLPTGNDAVWGIGIHRRSLRAVLTEAATGAGASLVPGARVLGVDIGATGGALASVSWADADGDHTREANLVVGADGSHSIVRPLVAPGSRVEATGYTSLRAVVADDARVGHEALVWWGPGAEFAVQRIAADRVSWQITLRHPEGVAFDDDLAVAAEVVDGWSDEVRTIVGLARPGEVVRHDLFALGVMPRSLVAGRTALVGDAAHPILPTLTQGANLALEDAVVLGHHLAGDARLRRGLAAFDVVRRPRADLVAERSRRAAALGVDSRLGLGLRLLPDSWVAHWYRGLYGWVAPGA